MRVPQFLQRPRKATQVISGMFKYHGMEYLQLGQCEGGVMMLSPSGIRWMQTFRKLPTMQPSAKKHADQKWNGTASHVLRLKIGSTPINILFESATHHSDRSPFARPDLERLRAL